LRIFISQNFYSRIKNTKKGREKLQLEGKTIIVTGGSGRIGSAIVKALLERGAKVTIADVKYPKFVDELSHPERQSVTFFEGDVTQVEIADKAIIHTKEKFGYLNGAVHSAYPRSSAWGTRFENLQQEYLSYDLNAQLGGSIMFAQRIIKTFRESKTEASLVLVSSIQGLSAPKFRHYEGTSMTSPIEYSAIKAGVNAIARYLAKYLVGENIRVNTVSPGGIRDEQPEQFLRRYREECVNKGMLDADDIVGAICFLLSDDAKYINGQNVVVDDGWSV
jgi:NAD(P)-dependent dehydrogenase (short-subunit alcohol dehydrogenase family)